ncbi:hypothetical protein NP493_2426g00000 [Ridgeia piscesae]|uniref:Secreted protein n=1 Tax=Ridgeia piscesae TaxID=27915 RepID=A0AAD9JGD4_RIDPI|nr:hypothetical protein NP493_2426g00000 [Ridgeia piscesae]
MFVILALFAVHKTSASYFKIHLSSFCTDTLLVWHRQEWYRIGTSSVFHANVYHLGYCIISFYTKIRETGLAVTCHTDNNFRHFCGIHDVLAFLPTNGVSVDLIHLGTIDPASTARLINYFYKTYVNGQ